MALPNYNPTILGFADGGKPETAEELLARISGKYNVANHQPTPAPQPQTQAAPQPQQPKSQPGSLIQQAAGLMTGRTKAIDKAAGYAQGGKIKGLRRSFEYGGLNEPLTTTIGSPGSGSPMSAGQLLEQNRAIEDSGIAAKMDKLKDLSGNLGSGLSARQKAAALSSIQGEAAKMGQTLDTGMGNGFGMSGLSARQKLAVETGALGASNAITDFGTKRALEDSRAMYLDQNKLTPGYGRGGKIKGPGTATSDSILAKTGTGEPIRVANGERIVSVEQDKALERIAEMLNYESVDAMFEALTGKPVGPTMKAGLPAAEYGSDPETLMKTVAAKRGLEYRAPEPTAEEIGKAASANFNKVFSDTDFKKPPQTEFQKVMAGSNEDIAGVNSTGAKLHHAAKGVLASVPALAVDAYRAAAPVIGPLFTGEDPKPGVADAPPRVSKAPSPAPVAPTPAQPAGSSIQAVAPTDLTGRQTTHIENNALRSFEDKGNGVVRQVGRDGKTLYTNVGTADITDPTKRIVDDSASALIDQKGSTYNPAAQLERMQRLRMQYDATDPTITDPAVRAKAIRGLEILNAGVTATGNAALHGAQARAANVAADTAGQTAAMHKEYLDPKTTTARRKEIHDYFRAVSGKGEEEWKIGTTSDPNPNNPMGPNVQNAYGIRGSQVVNLADQYKQQQAQKGPAKTYKPGDTTKDSAGTQYRFKGGEPSDKKNWEKI
jgi:hypothetical protein